MDGLGTGQQMEAAHWNCDQEYGAEDRKEMSPKAENRRNQWLSVFSFLLVPLTI